MHKYLIDDKWDEINKQHIKLELTKNSNQFGKFSVHKFFGLFKVVFNLWIERLKSKIEILYYPPSGPVSRKTFYKDFLILFFTRFLAKKTVFHFHADKFNNLIKILNHFELFLARKIYGNPDLCIVILEIQKNDVSWLNPKNIITIPNGIEDFFDKSKELLKNDVFTLLYIGLLVDYKGIEDAISACSILKNNGISFKFIFVGGWSSENFKRKIEEMILNFQVQDNILFVGEKKGNEKWKYFEEADVLCLPTRNDLMPLCIMEGMMMSLPIISTKIRTIPGVVDHEINGLLSNPSDPKSLADNILTLAQDKEKCIQLGKNGRQKFENHYHISKHLELMRSAIYNLNKSL